MLFFTGLYANYEEMFRKVRKKDFQPPFIKIKFDILRIFLGLSFLRKQESIGIEKMCFLT